MRGFWTAALLAAVVSFPAEAAPDAARGRAAAADRCTACHGANGVSEVPEIPSLAGQQAGFVTIQLILMREGVRQVPAMAPFVQGMADDVVEDLAAYYASLPPGQPDDRSPLDATRVAAGQALIAPRNCNVCHLPTLAGREQIPRLTHQREEFLVHAMTQYRDGRRAGPDTQMNDAVNGLSDEQILALAHYLAHRD